MGRRGESYAVEVGEGRHDLAQLAASLNRGRSARHSGRNEEAVVALREAVALYRGDLLAEAGTAEWVLGPASVTA